MINVIKRNGKVEDFDFAKIENAVRKAYKAVTGSDEVKDNSLEVLSKELGAMSNESTSVEEIQDVVEKVLMKEAPYEVARAYIVYRKQRESIREMVKSKQDFIERYKKSNNTANATIDDNSNVANKNIAVLNSELYKENNIEVNRARVVSKLKELYPDFDASSYLTDLKHHTIYKNDENSTFGFPYCVAISMYPFLTNGIKSLGGLSAAPKNIDSFCGMFINLVFAISSQYAGAVATSEFLMYFDYFARKEWGDNYYQHPDVVIGVNSTREITIKKQISQYFQQICYSVNQPASARGFQSVFWNLSIFDKPFFDGLFGDFVFPDGSKPQWESLNWLQKFFMKWFNNERLSTILTFPVVSCSLLYKDGKFVDEEMADFVAEEYSEGDSFFTYISDSVDSLSSCCFSEDQKVLWKSSDAGVNLTTFKELYELPYNGNKKNFRIFHNGSWVKGKAIKLTGRDMYKVVTYNNKEFIMTDNHINVTLTGEKPTSELTKNDYLMFNTLPLNAIPENDENLTYEQGFVVGAFLGDGSMGNLAKTGIIYDCIFSQNEQKYPKLVECINKACEQLGSDAKARLSKVVNNVYPVHINCKELVSFIIKWTNWERGTFAHNKKLNLDCLLQSIEFRRGILDGWYNTDGGNSNRCYTTSPELAEDMEVLITSLGLQSIINISDRTGEGEVIIRGEAYNCNYPLYCVRWYEQANHRLNKDCDHSWIKKNNSIYFKIKSIEKVEYNSDVYCFECSEEEPYFTLPCGLITHNCRLKNKIQTKEFNFTNGNMGVMTGSKSVITLNLNRIIQDFFNGGHWTIDDFRHDTFFFYENFKGYLTNILDRVYKYHTAYNELLWDLYDANLLPVYKAGFIDLNKQYLTVGLNGLTAAADFLKINVSNNHDYEVFCQTIFSTVKAQNLAHKTKKTTYNTELIPAESAGAKLYKWDKEDGYYVPDDINLYTSYIFKPYDPTISVLDKFVLHGANYIGDFLDGGAACHVNLDSHPSKEQCRLLLNHSAKVGCQYFTFNVPNCECDDCGFIAKSPFDKCPKCGSTNISKWDRVIGYLVKIKNWSEARQEEQKKRVYSSL